MKQDFNIKNTKLIIWDLDDTFWKGTLGEGEIEFKHELIDFVGELTVKGVMNSICSKNDYETVKAKFIDNGFKQTWDYFLFPSIDWTPKGQRVKHIIEQINLREENVIFVDDSDLNLNEAKYYCPNIMTATAEQIPILLKELYIINDYDFEYTRLKQYKVLEEKAEAKQEMNCTNEEFLKASHIKVAIKNDCSEHIERIAKLILRTNQLNFTKNRSTKEELEKYFADDNYENAYVVVEDKYGNYGICGFYTLDKKSNKLINFLFSCRIMSMGVEQYVYSTLKNPELEVVGEVASEIKKDQKLDWIEQVENLEIGEHKQKEIDNSVNILFKGPCDLLSTIDYISADCNVDTEFPYWSKKLVYISNHTHVSYIVQAHKYSQEYLRGMSQKFPFPNMDELKTNLFDPKYNLIFLSLLTSTHLGLYVNKKDGGYVVFGFSNCDMTDENNWPQMLAPLPKYAQEQNLVMMKKFKEEYRFAGNLPAEEVVKCLKYIRENVPQTTPIVITMGSEIESPVTQNGYGTDMAQRHKILNRAVEEFAKDYDNITLLNITQFIKAPEDFTVCINHFSRRVYVDIARAFVKIGNEKLGKEHLTLKV